MADLWSNRTVAAWEETGDIQLRMSDGHTFKTVVVRDLPKLVHTVGDENCFERP